MIAIAAAIGAVIALAFALMRLFAGPTLYDRVLGANAAAWKAALACAALAVFAGKPDWIDAAIALVLGVFVTNAGVLKFFRRRTFQPPLAPVGASGGALEET